MDIVATTNDQQYLSQQLFFEKSDSTTPFSIFQIFNKTILSVLNIFMFLNITMVAQWLRPAYLMCLIGARFYSPKIKHNGLSFYFSWACNLRINNY
jgi:hypothetical protein